MTFVLGRLLKQKDHSNILHGLEISVALCIKIVVPYFKSVIDNIMTF